jgi:hypothetical protein
MTMTGKPSATQSTRFGVAWVALCLALAAHVADEALTNFLSVYNPTVFALRERFPWFPLPVFRFEVWLTGLIALNLVLLSLSPFAFRRARWMRPLAYLFAAVMIGNGLGHTAGTVFGRTVASVRFERPIPGFYSSPILLLAAIFLLVQLRASRAGEKS